MEATLRRMSANQASDWGPEPVHRVSVWIRAVAGIALWAGVWFAYAQNQNYPFWYQWDEESKAVQLITGERNCRHPLLMLHAARVIHPLRMSPPGRQEATQSGRLAVAGLLAAAVALWAALAFRRAGIWAAIASACLMAAHVELVRRAHVFKEDGALALGWVLAVAGLSRIRSSPGWTMAGVSGAAVACAASGKYTGALFLPVGWAIWLTVRQVPLRRRALLALGFTVVAVGVWCGINLPLLTHWTTTLSELRREVVFLRLDELGSRHPVWTLFHDMGWTLWPGLGFYLVRLFRNRRCPPAADLVAVGAALVYLLALMSIQRVVLRHYLPLWCTLAWLSALGWGQVLARATDGESRARRRARLALTLGFAGLCAVQIHSGWRETAGYAGPDDRFLLARHLDRTFPNATVACDATVNLPDSAKPERSIGGWSPRTRLVDLSPVPESGSSDPYSGLRKQGVTHVVLRMEYVERYERLGSASRWPLGQFSDAPLRIPFYRALRGSGPVLWTSSPDREHLLRTRLELYAVPEAPSAGPDGLED